MRPVQEVEGQYREGTLKHTLVAVLKAVQPEALSVQGTQPGHAGCDGWRALWGLCTTQTLTPAALPSPLRPCRAPASANCRPLLTHRRPNCRPTAAASSSAPPPASPPAAIVDKAQALGLREFEEKHKAAIGQVGWAVGWAVGWLAG